MEKQVNNYNLGYSIKQLKEKWKFILITLFVFFILGICCFYYMKKPPLYTAQCILLYQTDNSYTIQGNISQEKNTIEIKEKTKELPINLFSQIIYSYSFLGELIDINITNDSIQHFSKEQISKISSLKNNFRILINEPNKLITIEATASSPVEAAKLAQKVQQTLYKYTLQWYTQQKKKYTQTLEDNYKYLTKQSPIAKQKLTGISSNNNSSNYLETFNFTTEYKSLEKLRNVIAEQLLKNQLEQLTPEKYFEIIDPVLVPNTPSNVPKSIIYYITIFLFLGLIISIYLVLIHPIVISLFSYQESNPIK